MNVRTFYATMGVMWLASVGGAYWLGSLDNSGKVELTVSASPTSTLDAPRTEGSEEFPIVGSTDLEREIEQLQQTLDERNKDLLRHVLDRIVESNDSRPVTSMSVDELIQMIGGQSGTFFGAANVDRHLVENMYLDDSAMASFHYILVMAELAHRKEQAVPALIELIGDERPDIKTHTEYEVKAINERREFAFSFLQGINDERAFVALLEYNESLSEFDMPKLRYLSAHVENLSSDELLRHAPRVMRLLGEAVKVNTSAHDAIQIAGNLVFVHNYSQANSVLMHPRSLEDGVGNALKQADEAHTSQSRRYVEWFAANHEGESARLAAERILADW